MPVKQMDSENQLFEKQIHQNVRAKSPKRWVTNTDGTPVSYKVYMTSDNNAAMANGCVRAYTRPRWTTTDNELKAYWAMNGPCLFSNSRQGNADRPLTGGSRDAISATSGAQRSFPVSLHLAGSCCHQFGVFSQSRVDADDFSYDSLKTRD